MFGVKVLVEERELDNQSSQFMEEAIPQRFLYCVLCLFIFTSHVACVVVKTCDLKVNGS